MKKKNILLFPLLVVGLLLTSCNVDNLPSGSDSNDDTATTTPTTTTPAEDVYYNVTFDLNYQDAPSAPSAQSIKKGGLVTKLGTDPTRDGYDFTFWSKNMYGSDEWLFSEHTVTGNMTLYASWTPAAPVQKVYYVEIPTWWDHDGAVASIYMWEGENNEEGPWPGQLMGLVHDRIYSYLIPEEYDKFIFARVSPSGEYWNAQTNDLSKEAAGDNNLYTISEDVKWKEADGNCEGVWSTYNG